MAQNKTINFAFFLIVASLLLVSCSSTVPAPAAPATAAPASSVPVQVPQENKVAVPAVEKPAVVPVTQPAPAAGAITMTDGLTRTITLPGPAQRIVSLAPSNSEILFAIGAGSQVIARDGYTDYPEAAKALPNISGKGVGEINLEMIVSLKPDLVLASSLTAPEQVQALEKAGLKVFVLVNPKDLEGMYANLVVVGKLTGHADQASMLAESLKVRAAALEARTAGVTNRPLVFYEVDSTDPSAPWTPGPGTFIDTLLTKAGGRNLGNVLKIDWGQVNIETLLTQNPDYILLGDSAWGGVTPKDVAARSGWSGLAAVKNNKVLPFDDNLVSRPGPRMVDGLEALARLLHPELFK